MIIGTFIADMKLSIILFVIFVSLDAVAATSFTRLLGSALAVQKKVRKDATKANNAHAKTKKIKVAPVQSLKDAGKFNVAESAVDLGKALGEQKESKSLKVAQKQDAFIGGEEMFLTIAQMMLSRFIMKVNYKDPKALVYSRAAFVAYLALFQALIWLLKYLVNKRDDHTILAVNPSSGIDSLLGTIGRLSGQSAMTNTLLSLSKLTSGAQTKTLTVKDHDLEQVQKLSSKLYFDLAMTSVFHYLFGFQSLVLLTPMRGVAGLLKNPLILLHVFRMKPAGKLSRPFKTPLEEFMGSLAKPKVPGSPPFHVESAEISKPSAKRSAESTATSIDSEPLAAAASTIVMETVVVPIGENDEDEEIENEGEVDIQKEAIVVTEAQQKANIRKNQVKDSAEMSVAQPEREDKEEEVATSEDEPEDEEENQQENEYEGEGEVDDKDADGDEEDVTEEGDDDDADQQEEEEEGQEAEGDDGEVDEENDDADDTVAADEDTDIDEDDAGEDDATDVEPDENVEDDVEDDVDEAEEENTEEEEGEEEGSDNDTEEEADAELLKAIDRFGK